MNISHIIIPTAGFGTRFLPVTKTVPKGLLPVLNKPAIQYIIQEGIASGVNNFSLIVDTDDSLIKNYFSPNAYLEKELKERNKNQLLSEVDELIAACQFSYITQQEKRGLGHAIMLAQQNISGEYVGVMLPDDLIVDNTPCMQQLHAIAKQEQAAVIAVMEVPQEEISAYGSIKIGNELQPDLVEVADIIEKPKTHEAFSNQAIIGRYILPTAIFDILRQTPPHANGEVQLTDAITSLIQSGHRVLAYRIKGKRFDLGRPPGWLAANNYLQQQKQFL